jgi:hypothetical protein
MSSESFASSVTTIGSSGAGLSSTAPQPTAVLKPKKTTEQLIAELEKPFFTEGFDPVRHLFQNMPADVTEQWLEAEIDYRDTIQSAINARLSESVMKNYGAFGRCLETKREAEGKIV